MSNHVTLAVATTTQKATFHRTRNKCKREYVLPEAELHAIAIRKVRFGLPKSGNTKVVPRKRFIDMIMWLPQRLGRCLA